MVIIGGAKGSSNDAGLSKSFKCLQRKIGNIALLKSVYNHNWCRADREIGKWYLPTFSVATWSLRLAEKNLSHLHFGGAVAAIQDA